MACPLTSYHDIESPSKRLGQGQVQVIFGPMFSGKTTELIRRLKRYQIANHRCLIIKYANDNRYADKDISTHDKQTLAAVSATVLRPLKSIAASSYSVIGIDEGQFFPDCVPFAEELANLGKIVVVAALDATFQRQAFGDILGLVPIAESVVKLNAVCMECFRTASYTKRKGSEKQVEVIGGTDKYLAVCRRCYFSSPTAVNGTTNGVTPDSVSPVRKALKFNGAS